MTNETENEVIFEKKMGKKQSYDVGKKYPTEARRKPNSYVNTNDLHIPEDMAASFAKAGFHLRWVRFITAGTMNDIDYRNLGRRIQQGYSFVSIDEAPILALSSFKRDIEIVGMAGGDYKNVVIKGDLALMKVPVENVAERQDEMRQFTRQQLMSVNQQARSANLANESRSESRNYKGSRRGQESKYVDFAQD